MRRLNPGLRLSGGCVKLLSIQIGVWPLLSCGFDIETYHDQPGWGLQPWRRETTVTAFSVVGLVPNQAVGVRRHTWWLPEYGRINLFAVDNLHPKRRVYTWNGVFDVAFCLAQALFKNDEKTYERLMQTEWYDSMLLWKRYDLMDRQRRRDELKDFGIDTSYSLSSALKEFMPKMVDDKNADVFVPPTAKPNSKQVKNLLKRNTIDALAAWKLGEKFLEALPEDEQTTVVMEMASIATFAESWLHGIFMSKKRLKDLAQEQVSIMSKILKELKIDKKVLNSPAQLGTLLFDKWKLPVIQKTKAGNRSTDKFTLYTLAPQDERVKMLIDYRKAKTIYDKYVKTPLQSVPYCGDGRTHPAPKMAGTYTGRATYDSKTKVYS